jgi:hypothetical protein
MKKILLAIFTLSFSGLFAQLDYQLTYSNSTYTELSGANDISNAAWSSEYVLKMPFSFKYFDKSYDTMHIMVNTAASGVFFSTAGVDLIFFGTEQYVPENDDIALSPVSYITTGQAPNRILKLQFKNIHAKAAADEEYTVNYQFWFHETTNKIEYHFGPNVITDINTDEFFFGMIDYDNSPYLAIDSSASKPVLTRIVNAGNFNGINTHPANGQVYTLTPKAGVSVNSLSKPYKFNHLENSFKFSASQSATVEISDLSGKSLEVIDYKAGDVLRKEFAGLSAGIYLVNIRMNETQFIEKIVVR